MGNFNCRQEEILIVARQKALLNHFMQIKFNSQQRTCKAGGLGTGKALKFK